MYPVSVVDGKAMLHLTKAQVRFDQRHVHCTMHLNTILFNQSSYIVHIIINIKIFTINPSHECCYLQCVYTLTMAAWLWHPLSVIKVHAHWNLDLFSTLFFFSYFCFTHDIIGASILSSQTHLQPVDQSTCKELCISVKLFQAFLLLLI